MGNEGRASRTETQALRIRVKIISTGELPYIPFMAALDSWVNGKGVEIARDADIVEFESDAEREQLQRIVKGVWNLMSENPKTAYMMHKEELDALEEAMLNKIIGFLQVCRNGRALNHQLIGWLHDDFLTHKEDTIRRRVDSIVEKGRLDRIKDGTTTFYALKPTDRIHREIITT